jgi:hypothetical protein
MKPKRGNGAVAATRPICCVGASSSCYCAAVGRSVAQPAPGAASHYGYRPASRDLHLITNGAIIPSFGDAQLDARFRAEAESRLAFWRSAHPWSGVPTVIYKVH